MRRSLSLTALWTHGDSSAGRHSLTPGASRRVRAGDFSNLESALRRELDLKKLIEAFGDRRRR